MSLKFVQSRSSVSLRAGLPFGGVIHCAGEKHNGPQRSPKTLRTYLTLDVRAATAAELVL